MSKFPVLFISHGPPNLEYTCKGTSSFLKKLGASLPKPKAILCVSAHWNTRHTIFINHTHKNSTIHDFGGFEPELYRIQYNAKGDVNLSSKINDLLKKKFSTKLVDRGLDHGAWVPIRLMYPECDIPVIQISSAVGSTEDEWVENLVEMGKLLAPLRKEGVLFIGSGSATHNLQDFFIHGIRDKPSNWVIDFVDFLKKMVKDKSLIGDLLKHKNMRKAHPTIDHLVPIAFCIGAAEEDEGKVIHEDWFGNLSLMCSQWG